MMCSTVVLSLNFFSFNLSNYIFKSVKKCEMTSYHFMKVGGIKTWKELAIGVQQLVKLLFNNNFMNPGLVL